MNTIEQAVTEETAVESTEKTVFELSLPELDMIGGGNMIVAYN